MALSWGEGSHTLTLGELITHLKEIEDDSPDSTLTKENLMKLEVVFETAYRSDLTLLSCYVSDGKVCLDIGTGEEI